MLLGERKKKILKAIVDEYIRTGEPVGSKFIAKSGGMSFSPATIRNEMSDLEAMGYIDKPHISAGRIPSDLGYREYVDSLMPQYVLSEEEMRRLSIFSRKRSLDDNDLISEAAKQVSETLGYASVAVIHKETPSIIRRFELIPINAFQLAVVAVAYSGVVHSVTCRLKCRIRLKSLEIMANILNSKIAGRYVANPDEIDELLPKNINLTDFAPVIDVVKSIASNKFKNEVFFDGTSRLLSFPEYSDVERAKDILYLIDNKEDLIKAIGSASGRHSISIMIGTENSLEQMRFSSLVVGQCRTGDSKHAAIGVIGPTRMDYSRVISSIKYIIECMEYMADDSR